MAYQLYTSQEPSTLDVGQSVDDAIAYLRARWADFVNLGPRIIDAQHRAAQLAYQWQQQGNPQMAELAKDVIRRLGDLNVFHGKALDKMQTVASWVGLGSLGAYAGLGAIPAAQITIITGLALLVVWIFRAYDAESEKLDLIEAGLLTPEQAAALDVGPAPTDVLGGIGELAKVALWGVLLFVLLEATKTARTFRRNPDLMVLGSNPPEEFGEQVHAVLYRHHEDGQDYIHEFRPGVEMYANADGSVTIAHKRKGRRVWQDFDV